MEGGTKRATHRSLPIGATRSRDRRWNAGRSPELASLPRSVRKKCIHNKDEDILTTSGRSVSRLYSRDSVTNFNRQRDTYFQGRRQCKTERHRARSVQNTDKRLSLRYYVRPNDPCNMCANYRRLFPLSARRVSAQTRRKLFGPNRESSNDTASRDVTPVTTVSSSYQRRARRDVRVTPRVSSASRVAAQQRPYWRRLCFLCQRRSTQEGERTSRRRLENRTTMRTDGGGCSEERKVAGRQWSGLFGTADKEHRSQREFWKFRLSIERRRSFT